MSFWCEVAAGFLANIGAGVVLVIFYVLFQWFLRATDITISYNWTQDSAGAHPNFNIRNRSKSTTYLLANIEYRRRSDGPPLHIDNHSVWDEELRPGSVRFLNVAPVKQITSLRDCEGVRVSVRLQNGRSFWLRGQGPGQMSMGVFQRAMFRLRQKSEARAFPFE